MADLLNLHHTGAETYVVNAGMEPAPCRTTSKGEIKSPFNLRAKSNGEPGQLMVTFQTQDTKSIRYYALEHSLDNGENWQNGTYSTGSTIKLKGLPSRSDVMVRASAIGFVL